MRVKALLAALLGVGMLVDQNRAAFLPSQQTSRIHESRDLVSQAALTLPIVQVIRSFFSRAKIQVIELTPTEEAPQHQKGRVLSEEDWADMADFLGGEKKLHQARALREHAPRTSDRRVTFMPGGHAYVAYALVATDFDELIVVDPLPLFGLRDDLRPIDDILKNHSQDLRYYGYSSPRRILDAGGIWPVLIGQLLDLHVEFDNMRMPTSPTEPFQLTFTWDGRKRIIHYICNTDPREVATYESYVRTIDEDGVDVCLLAPGGDAVEKRYDPHPDDQEPILQSPPTEWTGLLKPFGYWIAKKGEALPGVDELARFYEPVPQSESDLFIWKRRASPVEPRTLETFQLPEPFDFRKRTEVFPKLATLMAPGGVIEGRAFPLDSYWIREVQRNFKGLLGITHMEFWSRLFKVLSNTNQIESPSLVSQLFTLLAEFEQDDLPHAWEQLGLSMIQIIHDVTSDVQLVRWLSDERRQFDEGVDHDRAQLASARSLGDLEHFKAQVEAHYPFTCEIDPVKSSDGGLDYWNIRLTRIAGAPSHDQKETFTKPVVVPTRASLLVPLGDLPLPTEDFGDGTYVSTVFLDWLLNTTDFAFTKAAKILPQLIDIAHGVLQRTADDFHIHLLEAGLFGAAADELQEKLIAYLARADRLFAQALGYGDLRTVDGMSDLLNRTVHQFGPVAGFFLRPAKLEALLRAHPPTQLEQETGLPIDELTGRYGALEIFSVIRMVEPPAYLKTLLERYSAFTADDFEWRPIKPLVFPRDRYPSATKKLDDKLPFWEDKLAGTVYGVPYAEDAPGVVPTFRAITRAVHYLSELNAFGLFLNFVHRDDPTHFGERLQESLAGSEGRERNDVPFFHPHHLMEMIAWEAALDALAQLTEQVPEVARMLRPFTYTRIGMTRMATADLQSVYMSLNLSDLITVASRERGSVLHAREMIRLYVFYFLEKNVAAARMVIFENLDVKDLLFPPSTWTAPPPEPSVLAAA